MHACWAHSDSCYFRSISTPRQVHCQVNTVLGFCPAVPSPPLLTRMTCSGTGESTSVHSPAMQSHKKNTNWSLRSLPLPGGLRYYHEKVHSWLPFAKGALKACLKVNHLIFLLCLKGFPCIKTNSQFVLTATRVRNSDSAVMDLPLYVLAKTS